MARESHRRKASYRAYYRWDNTTRYQATYTRNKVSQITKNVEIVNGVTTTWDYTYSNLGWLTAVTKNGAAYQSYVYDANGNRTSIVAGGTTTGATYDAQDRLTAFGTTTFSYNNAGDLISSSVGTAKTDSSYDIYGNLLSVKKPTGTTITYNTDPLGRRIKKSVNGTMVQGFLWADELHPIAELDGAGKLIATFIYAEKGNVPSAMLKGGSEYRIISDHLGSVRLVVNNNNGSKLQQLDYDPYGRVIVDTNPGFQPFGYAGGLYDRDTGLVRFGRRDYDPVVGRWTSKDPIGFAGGLNLYGYVVQDPVNLVDPTGRAPVTNNSAWTVLYKPENEGQVIRELKPREKNAENADVDGIYLADKKQVIKIPDNCSGVVTAEGSLKVVCDWRRLCPINPLRLSDGWFPGRPWILEQDFFTINRDWPDPYKGKNGWKGRKVWQ